MKEKHYSRIIALIFVILAFSLSACRTKYIPVESKMTITETIRDTIVDVRIETEYVKAVTPDTISTLETKYARSTAKYHGDTGLLEHDIQNKDENIPVNVPVKEKIIEIEKPVPYPIEVKVPVEVPTRMPLRWWEKLFMYIGIGSVGYYSFRLYKKIKH